MQTNHTHDFDEVVEKAIPYLIYGPEDFVGPLRANMAAMYQAYEQRAESPETFQAQVERVRTILACPEIAWGTGLAQRVHSFQRERQTWEQRIRSIEARQQQMADLIAHIGKEKRPEHVRARKIALAPLPTVTSPKPHPTKIGVIRVRRRKKDTYGLEDFADTLEKLAEHLNTMDIKPKTYDSYMQRAKSVFRTYGGNLPTEEEYRADLANTGLANKYIGEKVIGLRLLRKIMGGTE